MSKGSLHSTEEWFEHDQLQILMTRQQKYLDSKGRTNHFDPHKYFGGWEPIERKSIEWIQMNNRLKQMMDYDEDNNKQSKSKLGLKLTETLPIPSIPDEAKLNTTIPYTNKPRLPKVKI